MDNDESTLFARAEPNIDLTGYETEQVFFQSKDGTRVPMFIVYREGLNLDGNYPTLLYGYGGFDSSQTPSYRTARMVWLEMGGVLAIANLRGGGEYGRQWHLAGTKLQKQNVFDDFIAAAEWLIANGYTSTPKLVTTADHDDCVVPWHSFKFGAALQHAQGCDNPILIRVETRAGHGSGKPTWMRIEGIADQWAFLVRALEMEL